MAKKLTEWGMDFPLIACYTTCKEVINMAKTVIHLRLAELRRANHITQNELAEAIGTSFQTISKWENGITMPDITMLPVLAAYFHVSTDELLGLKPLKGEIYLSEETDSEAFWDRHLQYLMRSKGEDWNSDYLAFLVREVWKIDKPVSVLDCGCGYAQMAAMLMPLLPAGSSYTGVDFSSALTGQAEKLLEKYKINGRIIKGNFLESRFQNQFDLVICQSVLRHIGDSKGFIEKMIASATDGGLVICMDTNRELECSGLYVDGMDYGELCDHSGAIKHWNAELAHSERDYAAAMRSAYIMRELGLKDIGIRMNDKVSFVCPEQEAYDTKMKDFIASKSLWYSDIDEAVTRLINHGMTRDEAEAYVGKSSKICEYIEKNQGTVAFTCFKGKTITYGWKRRV